MIGEAFDTYDEAFVMSDRCTDAKLKPGGFGQAEGELETWGAYYGEGELFRVSWRR